METECGKQALRLTFWLRVFSFFIFFFTLSEFAGLLYITICGLISRWY